MTQTLLPIDLPIPPRPTEVDPREVALRLLPDVLAWMRGDNGRMLDPDQVDSVTKQLADVLDGYSDGYALARDLDREGWIPDSELVEILDNAQHLWNAVEEDNVAAWVERYNVQCPFVEGQPIEFRTSRAPVYLLGEVTDIYAKHAKVVVFCQSLGHVREGNGTRGVIVPYEACRAIPVFDPNINPEPAA